MKNFKKVVLVLLILVFGMVGGYALTVYSLFPTCHGHIFAEAPMDLPYGKAPEAVWAYLDLVHDMSLLREQSWYYVFNLIDANGKKIRGVKFDSEMAGGIFDLNTSGKLEWDKDAEAVTARINDFIYTMRVD